MGLSPKSASKNLFPQVTKQCPWERVEIFYKDSAFFTSAKKPKSRCPPVTSIECYSIADGDVDSFEKLISHIKRSSSISGLLKLREGDDLSLKIRRGLTKIMYSKNLASDKRKLLNQQCQENLLPATEELFEKVKEAAGDLKDVQLDFI